MWGSDPFTFASCYVNAVEFLMKPVILTMIIVSSNHAHKTAVNTKNGTDTFMKGKYELPNWLIVSSSNHDNPDEDTAQAMIRDWNDSSNCMFLFEPWSSQEAKFIVSKRGTHAKNMPKFADAPASELASSMSFSHLF